MDGRELRVGALVWRDEPDGTIRRGEVVGRDPDRRVFNVAWLDQGGGVFHVPEVALDGGGWGLGEPGRAEAVALRPRPSAEEGKAA